MDSEKLNNTDALPKLNFDDLDEPVIYGYQGKVKSADDNLLSPLTVFLLVVLALSVCVCAFIFGMICNQAKVDAEQEKHFATSVHASNPSEAGANAATITSIINSKARTRYFVPLYMQWDSQWANKPYGSGVVADTGCGLCCGAMAVQILTGTTCTPDELANLSSGAMLTDGVNDVSKIVRFIRGSWGADTKIETTDEITDLLQVSEMVNNDWIALASIHGVFGDFETSESGHIVLIYDVNQDGFWIRDPYCITNNRQFSFEEFNSYDWDFFYCMKGEHVVRRY